MVRTHVQANIDGAGSLQFPISPGLNLVYAHNLALITREEKKGNDLKTIFVTGPGHGAPAVLAGLYLEGTISHFYPQYSLTASGFEKVGGLLFQCIGRRTDVSPSSSKHFLGREDSRPT